MYSTDPRGQLALEAETHVREGERGERDGEDEHDQLGAPPAAGHRDQRTRRVNGRRRGGDAAHECPVAGTRALAAMPNAVDGGHIAPAFGGCGPGLAGMLFARFLGLPGQLGPRHRGLVGVLLGHPVLQLGVLLQARGDRAADVRDDRLGVAQAAGRVGGLHGLLVGRRYLGELDPGLLVGLGQADPGDPLVDAAVDDHLALAVCPDVVLVLAPPPEDVDAADDHGHQHHQRGGHDRPAALAGSPGAFRLGAVAAPGRGHPRVGTVLGRHRERHGGRVHLVDGHHRLRSSGRRPPAAVVGTPEVIVQVMLDAAERAYLERYRRCSASDR